MRDYVQNYSIHGLQDLDSYVHPYVVFGNSGENPNSKVFDPTAYGVKPLSIIMAVTADKMV